MYLYGYRRNRLCLWKVLKSSDFFQFFVLSCLFDSSPAVFSMESLWSAPEYGSVFSCVNRMHFPYDNNRYPPAFLCAASHIHIVHISLSPLIHVGSLLFDRYRVSPVTVLPFAQPRTVPDQSTAHDDFQTLCIQNGHYASFLWLNRCEFMANKGSNIYLILKNFPNLRGSPQITFLISEHIILPCHLILVDSWCWHRLSDIHTARHRRCNVPAPDVSVLPILLFWTDLLQQYRLSSFLSLSSTVSVLRALKAYTGESIIQEFFFWIS